MRKGFTLIELLIVIAIIGLLATLAIVSLTSAQQKARDTKRIADIKQLQNAVELYFSESTTGDYPDPATWSAFSSNTTSTGGIGSYISNIPSAPRAADQYIYKVSDDGSEYVIATTLEDSAHSALAGDDDVNYSTDPGGNWGDNAPIASAGTAPTGVDCSAATMYCLSE